MTTSSMNASILSIGDELILGQTIDTSSAWISQQLSAIGCDIVAHMTVPDDQPAIERAIRDLSLRCDVLIVSGGIGPTQDDLTRQALAAVMGVALELNDAWMKKLDDFFKSRGRPMPPSNAIQAMIPQGAAVIDNPVGTAAGVATLLPRTKLLSLPLREGRGEGSSKINEPTVPPSALTPAPSQGESEPGTSVFVLPGVPKEMKAMFNATVLPYVKPRCHGAVILQHMLHTFGSGESSIGEMLGDLMKRDRNPSVGTTVSGGVVSLRINARFPSLEEARRQIDQTLDACRKALGDIIYGQDAQTLPQAVADLLLKSQKTVATAESCTGGLLAKCLTDISGSSAYFTHGWVTYSNDAKRSLLGVSEQTLATYGAVSEETVKEMADGAREKSGADFALSISGVAGPTGGTPEKPVGMVCIGLAGPDKTIARTFNFPGDREWIRDRSAKMALTLLRYRLLNLNPPF